MSSAILPVLKAMRYPNFFLPAYSSLVVRVPCKVVAYRYFIHKREVIDFTTRDELVLKIV